MPVNPPTETFVLEAKWHCDSKEEREELRNFLMVLEKHPLTFSFRSFFSHCRLCGRPRWMNTMKSNEDECAPSHSRSCQRWQERGGYEPPAANNV